MNFSIRSDRGGRAWLATFVFAFAAGLCAAPGARLTKGAFWLDRRYPIVNRWRDPS